MKVLASIALALPTLLAGCASGPSAEEQVAMVADARKASGALIQKLGGELKAAFEEKGPEGAIRVCKERAPQIAAEVSKQFGLEAKRVSPKNRNPAGVPDAWEAEAQAGLEKRLAAGEKPETLDTWQIVSTPGGKQFRYAKALPVQQVCLTCHGDPAAIPPAVKARLAVEYPLDQATGYAPGMVRGIVSIKRSL
jgi:type IV secretory pathway TrbL component